MVQLGPPQGRFSDAGWLGEGSALLLEGQHQNLPDGREGMGEVSMTHRQAQGDSIWDTAPSHTHSRQTGSQLCSPHCLGRLPTQLGGAAPLPLDKGLSQIPWDSAGLGLSLPACLCSTQHDRALILLGASITQTIITPALLCPQLRAASRAPSIQGPRTKLRSPVCSTIRLL